MKLNKLLIIGFSSILLTSIVSAEDEAPKEKAPKRVFKKVDADKDGKISEEEFMDSAKSEEKAKKRFAKKDKDADGFLSKKEFAKKCKCKKAGKKHKEGE